MYLVSIFPLTPRPFVRILLVVSRNNPSKTVFSSSIRSVVKLANSETLAPQETARASKHCSWILSSSSNVEKILSISSFCKTVFSLTASFVGFYILGKRFLNIGYSSSK